MKAILKPKETPPRAGDTSSPVGSNAEGKVETLCQPTALLKAIRFARENVWPSGKNKKP